MPDLRRLAVAVESVNSRISQNGDLTAYLHELLDVLIASPVDGDLLTYVASATKWENKPPAPVGAGGIGANAVDWKTIIGDTSGDTTTAIADGSNKRFVYSAMAAAIQNVISSSSQLNVAPSGGVTGLLAIANGGTGTSSPALMAGTGITITGSWPNQTIAASGGGGGSAPETLTASVDSQVPLTIDGHSATQTADLLQIFDYVGHTKVAWFDHAGALHLATPLAVAQGGSGATAPTLSAGAGITITGSWPNQTIAATGAVSPARTTATVTTASLANNATENDSVTMAATFVLLKVVTDRAARVRLYQTSAARTTDAARPPGGAVTPGTGLIFDGVTTAAALTIVCAPCPIGTNGDSSTTTTIYAAIQNKSGSSHTVLVTFTYLPMET